MRLGCYLSTLTKPELELLVEECNFSEEEGTIFLYLAKGKYIREIAYKMCLSEKTVERRIEKIKNKVCKVLTMKGGVLI